jgi:uncharacterized membrane protein
MKDFLNKTWVTVLGWVLLVASSVLLILDGTPVADINEGVTLVAGIVNAVVLLIAFIRKHIKDK